MTNVHQNNVDLSIACTQHSVYSLLYFEFFMSGNLRSSGTGGTRYIRRNGKNLLWEHISRCYFADLEMGLHQLPKLTIEHIHVTSFARMRVN